MIIQVDSREKAKAIKKIEATFDKHEIQHPVSKLIVGDYMNYDNPRIIVDRKQNLSEVCQNVCQDHERFQRELVKARDLGIHLVFLVEHGQGIKSLEDVYFWKNPRKHKVYWKTVNGKKVRTVASPRAIDGDVLYKTLSTICERYGVEFQFCAKAETGERIIEILTRP